MSVFLDLSKMMLQLSHKLPSLHPILESAICDFPCPFSCFCFIGHWRLRLTIKRWTLLVFRLDDQNEHRSVFDCVCIATDAPICWFSKAFNVRWSVWQASLICRANFSVIWNFLETQFAIAHGIMYQRLFFFSSIFNRVYCMFFDFRPVSGFW